MLNNHTQPYPFPQSPHRPLAPATPAGKHWNPPILSAPNLPRSRLPLGLLPLDMNGFHDQEKDTPTPSRRVRGYINMTSQHQFNFHPKMIPHSLKNRPVSPLPSRASIARRLPTPATSPSRRDGLSPTPSLAYSLSTPLNRVTTSHLATPSTPLDLFDLAGLPRPKPFDGRYPAAYTAGQAPPPDPVAEYRALQRQKNAASTGELRRSKRDGQRSYNPWDYVPESLEFTADGKVKSNRRKFADNERAVLEAVWAVKDTPNKLSRQRLGSWLGVGTKHITIWFQNRRQEDKRDTTPTNSARANPDARIVKAVKDIIDGVMTPEAYCRLYPDTAATPRPGRSIIPSRSLELMLEGHPAPGRRRYRTKPDGFSFEGEGEARKKQILSLLSSDPPSPGAVGDDADTDCEEDDDETDCEDSQPAVGPSRLKTGLPPLMRTPYRMPSEPALTYEQIDRSGWARPKRAAPAFDDPQHRKKRATPSGRKRTSTGCVQIVAAVSRADAVLEVDPDVSEGAEALTDFMSGHATHVLRN